MQLTADHLYTALAVLLIGVPVGYGMFRMGQANIERYRRFSSQEDLVTHLEANEIQSAGMAVFVAVLLVGVVYLLVVGLAALLQMAAARLG